ncbi:hypothetical protein QZM81_05985 [Burkholderia cepacia]|uniref:hypothetical protein n=1 Tax=Burkholderia cepacia TaxID=292 RepID=UPI0026509CD8|nr:hypothetical protein [Burkholderia cepacia]MDN7855352.1 hypothetical protein [Burkholderia cepacia]
MNLHELHGVAVAAWLVVLAVEAAVEVQARARAPGAHPTVAAMYGWIGLLAEAPLIAITVVTGMLLMMRMWPVSTLVLVKAALGLVAAAANKFRVLLATPRICVDDDVKRIRLTRRITLAGTAVPIGAAAWFIGYLYLHGE